jgi:hypothetical protein
VACVFTLIDPLNFIHVIESRCETYEIRVPNAKEMQIDKYAFPSFVLVFCIYGSKYMNLFLVSVSLILIGG